MERTLLMIGLSFWSLALSNIGNFATEISFPSTATKSESVSMSPDCTNHFAGTVFNDANFNGINDTEAGASGIIVEVFDSNNQLVESGHQMYAHFATDTGCSDTIYFKAPAPCPGSLGIAAGGVCTAGIANDQIGGSVWEDFDFNGIMDEISIEGVQGIGVSAIDCNGAELTTITDSQGNYLFTGLTAGGDYRIEFTLPEVVACWAKPTAIGTNNGTVVQFVQQGGCANLGIANPADYCEGNTEIATPCYVNGDPLLGGTAGLMDVLVGIPYPSTSDDGLNDYLSIGQEIGSTWGITYQRNTESIYAASFVKRHVGLGPLGLGGIYKVDVNAGVGSSFIDLTTLNINLGTFGRQAGDLPVSATTPNHDPAAFDAVGKIGLGDLDISDDEKTLYTVNLFEKTLVEFSIGENGTAPTQLTSHTLPNPNCVGGEFRPWGLGVHKGMVYVGGICSAENGGTAADMVAYVYKHNPLGPDGNFEEVLNFQLDYPRGNVSNGSNATSALWRPWIDEWSDIVNPAPGQAQWNQTIHPQAILSDIEFDNDGSMIIGFVDRMGHQGGNYNYSTNLNDNSTYEMAVGGDILRAFNDNGTFVLENNGAGPNGEQGTSGQNTGMGPGGAEFYWQDMFRTDANPLGGGHQETSLGGLAMSRGNNEVGMVVYDPITAVRSAGIKWLNNQTGEVTNAYQIFGTDAGGQPATFGKAAGLGDLELLCNSAPIEAGNFVWNDINHNGIQDACEEGIENVTLRLFDSNCNLINTTSTNASGNYVFTSLNPYSDYYIVLGGDGEWDQTLEKITVGTKDFLITGDSLGTNPLIDSDIQINTVCGAITDLPVISFSTEVAGCMVHGLDIGLKSCPDLESIVAQQSGATVTDICMGESLDLKLTYSPELGDIAVYNGPSGLTAAQLYDYSNHAALGINTIYGAITPETGGTMTVQTGLVPNTASITYYFILAQGNINYNPSGCLPMTATTVTVNPETAIAALDSGPHEICSENSPYVAGDENVIDLDGYVLSGFQGGTWSTTNTTATANLNGSTFTAVKTLAGETINFRYTVPGAMPASGTNCDDNIYSIQLSIKECYATLGNTVWEDKNGNGVQDDGATGIPGVTVELYECPGGVKGTKLETKTTNSNGNYLFDLLPSGEYCVKFDLSTSTHLAKADLKFTEQNSTVDSGNDTNDSDASPIDGCSSSYTLVAEDEELTVDAGVYIPSKIGDYVWEDKNYNGVQDSNEPGIENVTVTLSGNDGLGKTITAQSTTTDNTGMYMFGDLVPGSYNVTFSKPTGYEPTEDNDPSNNGNDELDSDANPDMSLITPNIPVESGDTIPNIDAGFVILSKLGDYVWEDVNYNGVQDATEPGIENVTVTLNGINGLGDAVATQTLTTDANGMYMFGDLYPGNYTLTFTQPNGYVPTVLDDPKSNGNDEDDSDANPNDNLETKVYPVVSGDTIPTIDAGFLILSKIGDLVWEDLNGNAIQNDTEPGIENVTVTLTGTNGLGDVIAPVAVETDPDGMYMIGDIYPGNYQVTFEQPTGFVPTKFDDPSNFGNDENDSDADETDNLTSPITLIQSGDTIPNVDAGFLILADLGDKVWEDMNGNAIQDPGEPGIPNATVTLSGNDGLGQSITPIVLKTTPTGTFNFEDLWPGDYTVTFQNPNGFVPTGHDDPKGFGTDNNDSDADPNVNLESPVTTLESGDDVNDVDAGFLILSKIGDVVWEDVDGNAIQNSNEPGIENVTVTLTGTNGFGDPVGPTVLQTSNVGMYMFGDLWPGEYIVTFSQPDGYVPTPKDDPNTNGDDQTDSDADPNDNLQSPETTIVSGDTIPTIDGGFLVLAEIGDFAWQDYDADGIQDPNEDPFENIDLTLTGTDNMNNPVLVETTTDENGNYDFGDLWPGTYIVTCDLPTDLVQTIYEEQTSVEENDSDFDLTTNQTTPISVVSKDTFHYLDAGFYGEDFGDAPNTFETTEAQDGPIHVIQPGKYLGTGVDAELNGKPQATSGYTGAGGDDNDPSNYEKGINPTGDENGVTFITPMIPGHEACIEISSTALSGNNYLTGWIDFSGNGNFESNEQLQWKSGGSTTADLLLANGVVVATYCFDVPTYATFDGGETHSRFRLSCETGVQPTGRVIGGEVEDYYEAFAKIGNLVWRDYEFEGDQDEPTYDGFNGVEVQLVWEGLDGVLGNADDIIYSTTTSEIDGENGKYCFFGAVPGDYNVKIPTIPAGFEPTQSNMTGDENTDSDGVSVDFTIAEDFNLPEGENGMTDNPTGHNYPDKQDNLQFDFGFIAFDYGDLPAGFPTKDADTEEGAHHSIIPCMYLGDAVDSEEDGAYEAFAGTEGAGGDDNTPSNFVEGTLTGTSDEDGVEFITPLVPGAEAKIKVTAKAPAGGAVLNAWIDFNGDGDFLNDPTEQVVFTKKSTSVINSQDAAIEESAAPVDYIFCFDVPADATFDGGETHVRIRLSKDGADYNGFAVGGEVEDYWIPFAKVGNYVWYDANHNGLQDEPIVEGHDGVTITLTWAGYDETLGSADDFKYTTVSATDENGIKGKYCFLGLQGGESYSLEATVPDGFVTTKETTTGVDDNDSNTPVIQFTLPNDVSNLPIGENGTTDNPGQNHGYADNQDNLEFDFGIVAFDFGDLPDEFKTTTAMGGAYHVINKGMYLGTCVDSDVDGVTATDAGFDNIGGDDQAGSAYFEGTSTSDDEDGFRLISPMIPGKEACIEITSTMPIGTDGIVNLFIDFNGDGDFENDTNEYVYFTKVNNNPMGSNTNGTVAAGENVITEFCFTVPSETTFEGGETHVRVRLSPSGFLSFGGEAIGGEVEDYYIPMAKVGSLAWLDYNDDGIQNEPDFAGYNGLKIELTAPGSDATLGTADDIIYDTYTADNDLGQKGTWEFCGLPEGDYQVEIFPEGLFPAKEGIGAEDQDSDPLVVPFTIGHTADGLFASENGMNEDPNGHSFPDDHNLLSIDFGFLAFDFGDIPDGFETFLESDGARHIVKSELYMGSSVDIEADAHTDFSGGEGRSTSGDNLDQGLRTVGQKDPIKGDEDGIRLLTPMIPGDTALLEVRYNAPDAPAYLNAFIDFGGNEKFAKDDSDAVQFLYDPNSHARTASRGTMNLGKGAIQVTTNPLLPQGHDVTCLIPFLVPEDATFFGGDVHLRFRLSTEGDLDYKGLAFDGEVEDYWFPVACAGNWVWYDFDKEGDQNESADYGMNDFKMYLQTPGLDGIYGTDDDFKYYQNTSTKDDIDGRFDFCGLVEGTYRVGYDEYPDYMIPAIPDHVSDDEMDSGGLMDEFTVSRFADNAPINEHGVADNMSNKNDFPDNQVTSNLDFGFIMDPVLGSALAIQGVDFAESNTCGHFNAVFDMCLEAFEVTDVNNLRATVDFKSSFGAAFIAMVKLPEVVESTATTLPTLNRNYDGENDIEMFNGTSGLLEKGQKTCYRFTVEIDPNASSNLAVQGFFEGGAVNDSGVEVPDLVNGGQIKEEDISDAGLDPSTSNQGVEGDTGGTDDPTQLTDCWQSSGTPACNDHIQVSLDGNGEAFLLGDDINEGLNAPCDDGTLPLGGYFKVEVMNSAGQLVGNRVDCSMIGQTLTVKSTHVVNCNECWGSVTVEDKWAPEITCGKDTTIDCTVDPATILLVEATDNCDPNPLITLVAEDEQIDNCNETVIVRSYMATDIYGNQSQVCQQTIRVTQTSVTFPDDITWTCEQFAFNQDIVNATELHEAILLNAALLDAADLCCIAGKGGDDVAGIAPYEAGTNWWNDGEDLDVSLDPNYDDNIDNPLTDSDLACGTTTTERDLIGFNLSVNVGCPYLQDCDVAPATAHAPQIIQVPIFDDINSPVEGLEDADVLELTGSGVPNVLGVDNSTCKFSVTYKDQKLDACLGVDTTISFKILRTWTVLNWCTGDITSDVQVIKVLDKKDPVIEIADDFETEIFANQSNGTNHISCSTSGPVGVPEFSDNCSGINQNSIRLITPFGEGSPILDADGNVSGFNFPAPYLPAGSHDITYLVEDNCGNSASLVQRIEVIDGTPPAALCRELTKVSLSSQEGGITAVEAKYFDEGSYDNCAPVYFKVRRMERFECDRANVDTDAEIANDTRTNDDQEWFDDQVKFCCADIGETVVVMLRVYDLDPGTGVVNTNQSIANGFIHANGRRNGVSYNDAFLNGHFNDCMIEVNIEDKSRPVCVAPEDVWANCNDFPANVDFNDTTTLNSLFGTAIAIDNCSAQIEELTPNVNIDLCGTGTISRSFRAIDNAGNRSLGSCRQTIMIMAQNSYALSIPGDFEEECDNAAPDSLTYVENGCDLLAINIEEKELIASPAGECKKKIVTYRVINWCEYDGVSQPTVLPRRDLNNDGRFGDGFGGSRNPSTNVNFNAPHLYESNGDVLTLNGEPTNLPSTGYYEYVQHVKIFDNTAPVLTYDGDDSFCGGDFDEDPCTGFIDIIPDVEELCSNYSVRWELDAFATTFGASEFFGDNALQGRYPLGTHTVRFFVSDECGNTSWLDITFEIIDCKAPTPVCFNGLSVQLMPTGMVEVWASDFDASSFDYCHDISLTANVVEDRNRDGFITSDDYLTTAPTDSSILLTCGHQGATLVQLWVNELSGDGVNQTDFCVTYIDVQDNNGVCAGSRQPSIAGNIATEKGQNISDVEVSLSGNRQNILVTDLSGNYKFENLVANEDYSISPSRNDDIRNGVTTYDLALISKHVLNVELLNSPYKLIAADANRSGNVSTLDLVAIRKVILWATNEFPNNESWRFVDKDFAFANPRNPFATAFPEAKSINNIAGDEIANFVGIKVGDVSGDAKANSAQKVNDRKVDKTLLFETMDFEFEKDEQIEIEFTSDQLAQLIGYQFTMHFETKMVDLVEIQESTQSQLNFGQTMVADGVLTASWNETNESVDSTAFKLIFNTKQSGRVSDLLSLSSMFTKNEAYGKNGEYLEAQLDFGSAHAAADFKLLQNVPNPVFESTVIGFYLPKGTEVELNLFDTQGRLVKTHSGTYSEGTHEWRLKKSDFVNGGIYSYQLSTPEFSATKKMIVIDKD